jgi:hypothetical protein
LEIFLAMNHKAHALTAVAVVCLAAVACLMYGCRNETGPAGAGPIVPAVTPKQDHLALAMDYLERLDEFDPQKGMVQTAYHLNRWIQGSDEEAPWQPPAMIDGLPRELRGIRPLTELSKRQFTTEDVLFLREASWMQSLSAWICQQTGELGIEDWLDQIEQSRGEPHAYELAVAARLFDWTVRNIQLEELLPYPSAEAGPVAKDTTETPRGVSPLAAATPGPGYTTFPWQTLMFGRGDAWQRARVFILLARQQQIDVVMLALDDPRQTPRPRPWLPAAVIDDQLYLFDAELGLPIPGPDGAGIATLEQVREDKELLHALDVGSSYPYAAANADLDRVVTLIDASGGFLSLRMKLVEFLATSGQQLTLSVDPSELAKRLRKFDGISNVELWQVPYETWIYRMALGRRANDDAELIRRLLLDEWIFEGLNPMVQGRTLHLRGKFETEGQREGAKAFYLQARVPDAVIKQIDTSPDVQRSLGIVRRRENDQQWQTRLQVEKRRVIRIKRNCSFWLGLIHYETGRYGPAADWLNLRVLEAAEDGPWTAGARYNLSRVYEMTGELEKARNLLLLDDSPQKHGNLLRARYLRMKMQSREP